mmetsp:Transcript_52844/g.110260  ORF Transcript_52844/g.110260 Transcript_52844/m.110260 type:complete len:88 (+) Transcript_52844:309-572(+)
MRGCAWNQRDQIGTNLPSGVWTAWVCAKCPASSGIFLSVRPSRKKKSTAGPEEKVTILFFEHNRLPTTDLCRTMIPDSFQLSIKIRI